MGFRENLKDELKYQDIRVKELADMTGISKHTLDHYLTEKGSQPQAELAVKIAMALNVSVEFLVMGKDTATPKHLKPEVLALMNKLNTLSNEDFNLVKSIVDRIR